MSLIYCFLATHVDYLKFTQIEREAAYNQFTMIVITGIRDIHIESIQEDGGNSLAKNLAHVYHFYLFGERGRSGNMKLPSLGNSRIPVSVQGFPFYGFIHF